MLDSLGWKDQTEQSEKFAVDVHEVIEELQADKDEILKALTDRSSERHEWRETDGAREYVLADIPNPRQIQLLAHLPFEISITEHEGRLILNTGTTDCISHEYVVDGESRDLAYERLLDGQVSFHTHPLIDAQDDHLPSYEDLIASLNSRAPMIIASSEKLLIITPDESVDIDYVKDFYFSLDRVEKEAERRGFSKEETSRELLKEFEDLKNWAKGKIDIQEWHLDDAELPAVLNKYMTVGEN